MAKDGKKAKGPSKKNSLYKFNDEKNKYYTGPEIADSNTEELLAHLRS